jgi:N-acetylglucosaminyl-diphospho-decaprenol L-rhamnosyltransferase
LTADLATALRPDVFIVNHFSAADTLAALASLEREACAAVHVVDNSVDADEAKRLREGIGALGAGVQLHIAAENLGFGRANNLAFERSAAPTVLLLNPDARLRPGALRRLVQTLAASPRAAAVAPRIDWTEEGRLVLPNLSSQSPAARIEQALASRWAARWPQAFARRGARHAEATMQAMGGSSAFDADALSGSVLLLRRAALLEAGGLFDPAYFMFFEDTDLGRRLRRAGWRLLVEPGARAWHRWHNRPQKAALMAQSERIYLERWHRFGDALQRRLVPRLHADSWRADATPVPVVTHAAEARASIGRFLALTPLPMLHPAGVRADGLALELSDEEWELLDPGRWYAWVDSPRDAVRWLRFDVRKG